MHTYEPFDYAGHRYDIQTVAADLEFVGLRRSVEAARAAGHTLSGVEGMFMGELRDTIVKRPRGIHHNTRAGMSEAVCACGLIVPADVPLDRATGHLDDQRWEPVRTLLISFSDDWWHEGLPCRAYCQGCGWLGVDAPYAEAELARLAHACEVPE
ncbi:hypothetical protein [Nocardioides sambongensis]|uniref:hypothetical protein n=1 Tax=Nocardioides sambongensis TaxID=2589074 RepID=UPI00112AA9E7|nr:hypothetical protein [Nocardioides sambongensis]